MGELCVEHIGLKGHIADPFSIGVEVDAAHKHEVAHYHDDDDADIVGKREHQSSEVILILYIPFCGKTGHFLQRAEH